MTIIWRIKQHLGIIWSSVYEKVEQHWGWVEKKPCLLKKKRCNFKIILFFFWYCSVVIQNLKWSNTLKQFVGNLPTNGLSVFDHFWGLMLKGFRKSNGFWVLRFFLILSNLFMRFVDGLILFSQSRKSWIVVSMTLLWLQS